MSQDPADRAANQILHSVKAMSQQAVAKEIYFQALSAKSPLLLAETADYVGRYIDRFVQASGESGEKIWYYFAEMVAKSPKAFCITCIQLHGFVFYIGPRNGQCACCNRGNIVWHAEPDDICVAALLWGQLPDICDECQAPVFNLKKAIMRGKDLVCDACVTKAQERLLKRVQKHYGGQING